METQSERPPPYQEAESLKLPPVPSHDVSAKEDHVKSLPPIGAKLSSDAELERVAREAGQAMQTPAGTILQPLRLPSVPETEPGLEPSPTDGVKVMSLDEKLQNQDVHTSMEDSDRMAAEALCGLRKVDSSRQTLSPSGFEAPAQHTQAKVQRIQSDSTKDDPEPLLQLITSSHPWVGGTIHGSLSAYSATKSHSPRFLQYGANLIERNIGSPMANTVGSVGRKTGVEGSLRKYLGSRQPSDLERIDPEILGEESASKKRRISSDRKDSEANFESEVQRTLSGHASIDTLPVYDENRSPTYEEATSSDDQQQQLRPSINRSWSTQLMISTSGLGVALNEASLQSLKYCLSILRSANTHVRNLMEALKSILKDHESSGRKSDEKIDPAMQLPTAESQSHAAVTISERIRRLNNEIWNTLKGVVDTVSRYTGGALPENASVIVKWQLMSVPGRWKRAVSKSSPPVQAEGKDVKTESEEEQAVSSAHRMLAFAIEGIDMMEQVGDVVDRTISSAEKWLDSMGRKKQGQQSNEQPGTLQYRQDSNATADVKMTSPVDTEMADAA